MKAIQFMTIIVMVAGFSGPLTGAESTEAVCAPPMATNDSQKGEALFRIKNQTVTNLDLPKSLQGELYKNAYEAYLKNLELLKSYALRMHLAKEGKKIKNPQDPIPTIESLISIPEATAAETKQFFAANKAHMPPGVSFEQIKPQIVAYMKNQAIAKATHEQVSEMEKKGIFYALLVPPKPLEIRLDLTDHPTKGNKKAKIEIVEVSDYQCGHCQKAHPVVHQLLKKYEGKVSFTQINWALSPQGISGTYVRGAFCANRQGVKHFWAYHDETFKRTSVPHDYSAGGGHDQANGNDPESVAKVVAIAKQVGLDAQKFQACLSSADAYSYVAKTATAMQKNGINQTPVFIVNQQKLARGVEDLEEAIKQALK